MANWSDLKAAVAEVIKTNDNQEITGQILQNVLNNIVSSVGENSTFAGIATPATNPGAPDGNVFYLAVAPGVYSNFGGIQIVDGEAVILEWRGSWVKKTTGFATQQKADKIYYHSIYEDDSIRSQEKRRINKIIKELYITPEKASIGTISLGNIRRNVTTSTGAGQWNVVLYDSSKSETTEVVSFSSINKKGSLELLEQDGNYCLIDWSEVDDGKTVIATSSSEYQLNISYISDINNFPIIALSTRQTISLKDEYIKMYNTPAISWVDDDFNLTSVPKIKNICDEVGCKCDFGLIPEYTQGTGDYPIDSIYSFSEEQLELIKQYELEGFHMQIHPVHKGWYASANAGTYQGRAWTEQSLIKTIRVFKDNSLLNDSCIIYPGGSSNFSDTVEMVKTWLEFGITVGGKYNVGIHDPYKLERYFIRISVSNTKTQIKAIIDEAVEKGAWLILGTHGYDFNDSGTIDEITPSLANLKEIIEYANSKINIKPIGEIYRLRKPMLDLYKK